MAGTQSHIDVAAPATVSIDSQPGRESFQERLGIFGFWNSALSLGFVPLRIVGELWLDPRRPISALLTTPSMIAHLGASAAAAVVWLLTRRRAWSLRGLHMLDASAHDANRAVSPSGPANRSGLEAIIMQCLAKTPSERPASARALEESLAACAAAREWTDEDARRWWADHADAARRTSASPVDPGAETVAVDLALR
jgi:hypothetical protein